MGTVRNPIERIISKMERIRKNPLEAFRLNEEGDAGGGKIRSELPITHDAKLHGKHDTFPFPKITLSRLHPFDIHWVAIPHHF